MLTHGRAADPVFTRAFLYTFQAWATPTQLLNKLLERLKPPEQLALSPEVTIADS